MAIHTRDLEAMESLVYWEKYLAMANAFQDWFSWPMKVDGSVYDTDDTLKSLLAEVWLFEPATKFYRAWAEGIKCGRIYKV